MDQAGEQEVVQNNTPEASHRIDLNQKFPLQTLSVEKGNIQYRDIEPEIPRSENNPPLLMMTGWAMNQEVVGNTVSGLYEKGQRVVPVDFEGGKLSIGDESEMLATLLSEMKDEKIDILGQSMAAVTILSMIEKHPELMGKIGKVLLVSPMGLGGKDSLLGLGKRQLDEMRRDAKVEKNEERKAINKKVGESFGKFLRGNPLRAVKEIWGMKSVDKYAVLDVLREAGIKTAIIQGDLDQLNSSERVWDKIGEGSDSTWKILTQEDYEKDKEEYDKRGIKPGQKVWDRDARNEQPPFDSIIMTSGGHEIHGPRKMADKIVFALDSLSHEFTAEELAKKREEAVVESHAITVQEDKDEADLAKARDELANITSENQLQ